MDNVTELLKQEKRITEARRLKIRLSELTTDLRTILHLLQSQLKALEELNEIFRMAYNHYPALREEPTDFPAPKDWHYENRLYLPFRLQEWRSLRIVLRELNSVTSERKRYVEEFKSLLDSLSTYSIADTIEQTEQAKAAQGIMKAQEVHAKSTAKNVLLTAKTMSMFTVVTTIFLPLNFFAAVSISILFCVCIRCLRIAIVPCPFTRHCKQP
jgi:aminoglycoside phosphotransferase (APT) family kinase protein